jgi:hypothetical protein
MQKENAAASPDLTVLALVAEPDRREVEYMQVEATP